MSGRRRPASSILLYFLWRLIAFVAFRRGCFWCKTGALRHTSFAGQRVIDQADRTVGSNPTLSAKYPVKSISYTGFLDKTPGDNPAGTLGRVAPVVQMQLFP